MIRASRKCERDAAGLWLASGKLRKASAAECVGWPAGARRSIFITGCGERAELTGVRRLNHPQPFISNELAEKGADRAIRRDCKEYVPLRR
jgi:hypothetical protein